MMEPADSISDGLRDPNSAAELPPPPARSGLGIDLNEIPSPAEAPADSVDVVRSYHDNPSPPLGGPASVPAAAEGAACAACGKPEDFGYVVVCDACERGFHVGCAGMRGVLAANEEWLCGDCVSVGVKSKRWPLGAKKRLLDMNASPPSDGDGDGAEEVLDMRKHSSGGNSFGGNPFGAPVTYSSILCAGNGFGFQKTSGVVVGFEDILSRNHALGRSFEEVDLSFPVGRFKSSNNTAVRKQSRNPSEIFLQALREFVYERHGELEEGWRVEIKQSVGSELYAVYCAPDGKTFDSVYEVACYLGLMSKYNSKEIKSEGCISMSERAQLYRKRKAKKYAVTNGFAENKEALGGGYYKELSSNGLGIEVCSGTFDSNARLVEAAAGESGCSESEKNNEGLPVQFEDFFLLSLGNVDTRPFYHNANSIWPIGFKSCWHDRITGSLFICEVLDGGDSGPVFRVKRLSCSSFPIPNGLTVLFRKHAEQLSVSIDEDCDEMTCDNYGSIQMILSDPCPPEENDILSCLNICPGGTDVQNSNKLCHSAWSNHENSEPVLSCEMGLIDDIGEFSAEENSSSLAWKMVSQKVVNACCEMLKRKGTFEFLCKHARSDGGFRNYVTKNEYSKGSHTSLDKFSSSPGTSGIASVIQTDKELDCFKDVLENWLNQDRFGLDVDFVQEILEQLPGVQTCSQYQVMSNRSSCSSSITVGNGLLVLKLRGGSDSKEKDTHGLFRTSKKAKLVEGHVMDDHRRPAGKKLCLKVPSELVGDVYQVWELSWRFFEILGLKEPLSLEELEEELINPWSENPELLEKFEKEIHGSRALNLNRTDCIGGKTSASSVESGLADSQDNPHAFIQMTTGAMKEAAQAKLASITYSRCSGVTLTKAHRSLLRVLIGELQSKVAALVDPNFDSGESKSKRGRKKDVDSSVSAKRSKLNILPINELTWPELARRYILAVLSMDGNLESAEIIARESGKVFRCLQGDGGVLCGSLTGVAGMEADALLLAEATRKIFGSADRENDVLTLEDEGSDVTGASEKNLVTDGSIPEWAQVLEPVRKLPTNVGTRIRKCVYEALAKNPPEWAKKILEHSISKEVYKGNASGPTKKAVLSVLADVSGDGLPPKPDNKRKKKKTVISISDVIMKQCRIVLRRAAAADDSKVFCNLLGRKLINSSDNDDEGLLGSPAMVSRPLDFRTIDLRLAAGAYGGSHETFLEDVRELWRNVRNAFGDQPDLVELAENLSQNFESLYEKEVISLVGKLSDLAKMECLNAERRKEIDDLLSSTSVIPKAPWDEGVCKVCGIDRDDDSVLLCDTCDAEYHTYCLNPPLARIPEGNWYCPSCVGGKRIVQDVRENVQVIRQRTSKKYQGEVTRVYLEALANLAAKMEEKEYWEFTVDERTFLLKFLCDELLNSTIIRQHLEQCAETSTELQQKLRSLFVEWKNLKSREETLVARVAKLDPNALNSLGAAGMKESWLANYEKGQTQSLSDKSNCCGVSADDLSTLAGGREGTGPNAFDRHSSASDSQYSCQNPLDPEDQLKDAHASMGDSNGTENSLKNKDSQKNDKSFRSSELPTSNSSLHEVDASGRETSSTGNEHESVGKGSSLQPADQHGHSIPSDVRSSSGAQHVPPVTMNELQAQHVELSSVKNEIAALQESITGQESELLKVSVRREFLGTDSLGRLYWASGTPTRHSWIIVDGSVALQIGRKTDSSQGLVGKSSAFGSSLLSAVDGHLPLDGLMYHDPYLREQNNAAVSLWVSYQTEEELDELVSCLKNNDQKERELRESILHWQKLRFQVRKNKSQGQDELPASSAATSGGKDELLDCLATRAANLLEKRHGPCAELEIPDTLKKRGKRARLTNDDKMCRCECLELIWPCRHHCFSCHRTFSTDTELEGHNEGKCSSAPLAHEKGKEISDSSRVKGSLKPETSREDCSGEKSRVEIPQTGFPELSAKLIKFQDEGLACPYNLEKICSKFVTKDSCKDLIQEIGLIGSKGALPFVPSISPCLSDSTIALMSFQKNVGVRGDVSEAAERPDPHGHVNATVAGRDGLCDRSPKRSTIKEISEVLKPQRVGIRTSGGLSSVTGVARCCVVPQSSLRPLVGRVSQILRRLKMNLLDMDAALPEEALRSSKSHLGRRWALRAFVKSATTIYEMVQATMILEDMIKTDFIKNEWWYWSSFSAAAKISTVSSLALRIYALDAAIIYEKISSESDPTDNLEPSGLSEQKQVPIADAMEKTRMTRRSNKKRKESEG